MASYFLSPSAQESLKNIRTYSLEKFGKAKTNAYLKAIRDRFQDIAMNPHLGTGRDEIKKGYRSVFVGSHTVYFRVHNERTEIIDVLHQSMEPSLHLMH